MNNTPVYFSKFFAVMLAATLTIALAQSTQADVRIPGFYSDHMVMQRDRELRIRGWAEMGETVTVSLGDSSATTTAEANGRWEVTLPPMQASSTGKTLRISGKTVIELNDVLIGEVWLCSGQSNMEWTVANSSNRDAEIAAANHPHIRHLKIAHRSSNVPLHDVEGTWQVCSPDVVGNFTATGYFMARHLQQELKVPIGLINSSWGGTRVEPWTPPIGFERVPALAEIFQSVMGRTPGTTAYRDHLSNFLAKNKAWNIKARAALESEEPLEPSPSYPKQLKAYTSHQDPTMLYNGMIHALVGYPIRGAIWYQGESNHADGMLYYEKKKALIEGWRTLWHQGEFPFYFVQIAPFQYGNEDPTILPRFWEAQAAVQQLPNTGMVVINDIATLNNIHPPNKQDVGHRLALLALSHDYGRKDLVSHSPEVTSVTLDGKQLRITFRNTGGGLKTRDEKSPTHFEILGPGERQFIPAEAMIDGDTVTLTSGDIDTPTAFRFAWNKLAEPNLMGGTGLPAGGCRGGKIPDFLSLLDLDHDYQLVYDLDLSKLGSDPPYDVDNSSEVTTFDRVGYLIELESKDYGSQKLFVSMDAFTDDASKIGLPTAAKDITFQQGITNMDVYSTESSLDGQGRTGNLEFWSHNYAPNNSAGVTGAANSVYDYGDQPTEPNVGYGSMQVHDPVKKKTLFSINHWRRGENADIGIGNSSGKNPDWTFSSNASRYLGKRLRIYVRPKQR